MACVLALASFSLEGQTTPEKPKLNPVRGPAKAKLGSIAELDVPTGYVFLDGKDTRTLLQAEREPVSNRELGWLSATNQHWSVIFEFSDVGYVKDDEKDNLSADKLLNSIKAGNDAGNKERERLGSPPIDITGWEVPPRYNPATHNLEWAIRGMCQDRPILNYNTRLLGRKGVMEVVLIVQPDQLNETLPSFRSLLAGYTFKSGETYSEYRQGDRIAKYGLGALVLGGAAVGAAKLGLFAWLAIFLKKGWKLVVVAFAALAGFVKKLFRGRGSKPEQSS